MIRNRFIRTLVLSIAAASICAAAAYAQSTTQGAIAGTVEDASEAVISNADVTIHNDGTNAELHLKADASGYFIAPLLEPGTYTVTITAPNFGTVIDSKVLVQVGQLTSL